MQPVASQQEAHRKRIGADHAQGGSRAPVDLGPGAKQRQKTFARVVPADEEDLLLALFRFGPLGNENPVWDDLVVSRRPALDRGACLL